MMVAADWRGVKRIRVFARQMRSGRFFGARHLRVRKIDVMVKTNRQTRIAEKQQQTAKIAQIFKETEAAAHWSARALRAGGSAFRGASPAPFCLGGRMAFEDNSATGWVKIYRSLFSDDEFMSDSKLVHVFVYLIATASRRPIKAKVNGEWVQAPEGSLVIGIRHLSSLMKMDKNSLVIRLDKLKHRDIISTVTGTEGVLVTVRNYSTYQVLNSDAGTERVATQGQSAPPTRIKKEKKTGYTPEFESLYAQYPRKEGKADGFQIYLKLIAKGVPHDQLERAVKNYALSRQGEDAKYTAHFSTFMNSKWEDWVERIPTIQAIQPRTIV